MRTAFKKTVVDFSSVCAQRDLEENLPQIPWQWHRVRRHAQHSKRHRGRLLGLVPQREGVSHHGVQLPDKTLLPSNLDCPGHPWVLLVYWEKWLQLLPEDVRVRIRGRSLGPSRPLHEHDDGSLLWLFRTSAMMFRLFNDQFVELHT